MRQHFLGKVVKAGINPCVEIPARVSAALARKGYIPVQGTLNGHPFLTGLVSLGHARHRLFINGQMRKQAGVEVGDRIELVLDYDPRSRRTMVPKPLTAALTANPLAKRAWNCLTPSKRKEILNYLNSLKRPETVDRNVERTIEKLLVKTALPS